jgi:hypothetical protein
MKKSYVKFEQSKLLKEKLFPQKECNQGYSLDGEDSFDYSLDLMNGKAIAKPEQHEVVEWLLVEKGIFIGLELIDNTREFYYQPTIWTMKDRDWHDEDMTDQAKRICEWREWQYSTPQQAYSAAFDYIFKELI